VRGITADDNDAGERPSKTSIPPHDYRKTWITYDLTATGGAQFAAWSQAAPARLRQ